jgi:ubiquinone/menaquinone biosynthesis C-methylase UbiE
MFGSGTDTPGAMTDEVTWETIADWYDAKQGDDGDLWHRSLIDPGLLRLLGKVRGLSVLDLACGNGYLARRYAREGAASVVGVDASAPIIALARRREARRPLGVRYEVRDAARLSGIASRSFDLVASNMAIMDIADAAGAMREVGRVLRPGGRFVFSICHPCFDINERSMWVEERPAYEREVWRKVSRYREEGPQWGAWKLGEGRFGRTRAYHRTLGTYSEYLARAHLMIRRLGEPSPLPEVVEKSPQGAYLREIPLHLVFETVRVSDSPRPVTASTRRASRTSGRTTPRGAQRSGSRGRRRGIGSARRGSTPGS